MLKFVLLLKNLITFLKRGFIMYQQNYILRYGDLDNKGYVKIATIFDILQDISTRHSAAIGFDIKTLYSMNIAFLLKGWRVKLLQPIDYFSDVVVLTGIMKIRHFETIRKYEIWQNGILKLIGTGNWIPVDTVTKKIIVCPEEIKNGYDCINEDDNEIPFVRVREDENIQSVLLYQTQKRDIDTNGHINNVKSLELALETLPDNFIINEIQVTYVQELKREELINVCESRTDDFIHIELKNDDGKACVLINVK